MGLRDKYAKKIEEQGFRPIELSEENVQAIFNRCLANRNDPSDDVASSKLFQRALGYDEDSKPVFFSKTRIEQNKKIVFYLLGQLRAAHNDSTVAPAESNYLVVSSAESIYRYDEVKWTSDTVKLIELYHLGECTKGITPFMKDSNWALIRAINVKPTLSPKDPAFPAWWEQHKSEWEQ